MFHLCCMFLFVDAMNRFIAQYNSGHGMVWPRHEAEKLGKAMRAVQGNFAKPGSPKLPARGRTAGPDDGHVADAPSLEGDARQ